MANIQGGYECQFVKKPPSFVQSECPICLQVLREPYQATCCGYSFCRACIERIKARDVLCPCCKSNRFDHYPNKGLQRSLCEFKVYCSNTGCQWVGELGQLDNHLNLNPSQQNQLQGCYLSQIKCLHCSELFLRFYIEDHQNNRCPRRPFSCEYCKTFKSTYKKVATKHWPVCGSYPVPCTNKCGETLQRQNLENHIANDCPQTIINCDFQHVGCEERLLRKDMPAHLQERALTHLSLHMNGHKKLVKEAKKLKQHVAELEQNIKFLSTTCTPTHLFIMKKKIGNRKLWRSPSFYSHFRGYKMGMDLCLGGPHIIIRIYILKGMYDEHLRWPFHGSVTVSVIGEKDTFTKTIICNALNAVSEDEYAVQEPNSSLTPRFLDDYQLYIKVSEVCVL